MAILGSVISVVRAPQPMLRPFIEKVWASHVAGSVRRVERTLPARAGHLVFRLDDEPVEIVADGLPWRERQALGTAVVGGPRTRAYARTAPTKGRMAGAVLRPGATETVLGVQGSVLANCHTRLDDFWGRSVDAIGDRLAATASLEELLDAFEAVLVKRLRPRALHPAVALAVERLAHTPVGAVVKETGYSHRRFDQLFKVTTGLGPKRYSRLARFERMLEAWRAAPHTSLCELAYAVGYSDQAHLSREFKEFAGMTLGEYRRSSSVGSRHVPLPGNAFATVQIPSRQDGAASPACER